MPLRPPPGRAGRTWLLQRLELGRRGLELLERKRDALLRERARVEAELEEAGAAWEQAAAEATLWSRRSAVLDGAVRQDLLARHARERAWLELRWRNLMGARLPQADRVEVPDPPPAAALGGGAAAAMAGPAWTAAMRAAVRVAVAARAAEELSRELEQAGRRLRALRDRWIPEHERALAALDLALDESQREQAVRVRWLVRSRLRQLADAGPPGDS